MAGPANKSSLHALFATAPVLSDTEVSAQLREEVANELRAADAEMAAVIADARSRIAYLSASIFDPVEKNRDKMARAEEAVTRSVGERSHHIVVTCARQLRLQLDTSIKLRAIRSKVAHLDPPDYWERRRYEDSQRPIYINARRGEGQ